MNKQLVVFSVLSFALGAALVWLLQSQQAPNTTSTEKQPLYWVAPMDSNYRRDGPGKSPMGMDLVPVYEENDAGDSPGTVKISSVVVNNLGVRTGLVERRTLESEIKTVGYVRYDENQLIHIHPRVSGWVEKLHIKATGDPVEKGQPLYALYSPELVNAQAEYLLALDRKDTRLISATEEKLLALHISRGYIDKLKATRSVEQTVTFYAPQNGVVDNLAIREGIYVEPQNMLFSIGALDTVWVEAEIFERQSSLVKQGDSVVMSLDFMPGREWMGKVDYIYPTLNESSRTLPVRISFENSGQVLKPNMFATLRIQTQADESLTIPTEALIRTGAQNRVVIKKGEGEFKSLAVKVGRITANYTEILEGLNEGEEVVTSAQFLLDSESSKTSDFVRMESTEEAAAESVWVLGDIKEQYLDLRKVKARHDPIPEWDWPEMVMDFTVADEIDIEQLTPGTVLHMEIIEGNMGYDIIGIHIMDHAMDMGEE